MAENKFNVTISERDYYLIRLTLAESGYPCILRNGEIRVFDLDIEEESKEYNEIIMPEFMAWREKQPIPDDVTLDEFISLILGRLYNEKEI